MSESWKNRLWSLLLVCTFAVVLSVCNKAVNSTSDGSSSSGTAFADGSTVTISSQALPTISHYMYCSSDHVDGTITINYFGHIVTLLIQQPYRQSQFQVPIILIQSILTIFPQPGLDHVLRIIVVMQNRLFGANNQ